METPLQRLLTVAAAWILSLGFDLFLHGGLLAAYYVEPSPFLLSPAEAFRRIPLGYLSFLILTLGLFWLFTRLGVSGPTGGFRYGCSIGLVVWGGLGLGLLSISTIQIPLLLGWWLGQSVELGLAGAVLGSALTGVSQKRIWGFTGVLFLLFFVLTVLLQSLGWAPAVKM